MIKVYSNNTFITIKMYFSNTFIIETFVFVKNSPYICREINHKIIMQDGTHGI